MAAPPATGSTELTIGELAARSGTSASALRFYEKHGLIHSRRTSGNQRRYSRDTLRRVAFIRASQRVGISLSTIGEALALLPSGRTPTREDWAEVSARWHRDLTARISQLQELRDHLTDCIGCGCLSLDFCHLANPGDELGRTGCGPRLYLRPEDASAPGPAADAPMLADPPAPERHGDQPRCAGGQVDT